MPRGPSERTLRAAPLAQGLRREGKSIREIVAATGLPRATVGDIVRGIPATRIRDCVTCGRPFIVDLVFDGSARRVGCSDFCTRVHRAALQAERKALR